MAATMQAIRGRVLRELDAWTPDFREALAAGEPAETVEAVLADARERLGGLAEQAPDPGWTAPHVRAFLIGGMIYLAVYGALASRGYDARRAWEVCDAATRAHVARMGGLERRLASAGMFSWPVKALQRWFASRSQRAPVGGWVMRFVEGEPGRFDFGVDYHRCAIHELALATGAAEFAPYICLADVALSEALGWGLQRTETLAQGGARCDFRLRRGAETRVRVP